MAPRTLGLERHAESPGVERHAIGVALTVAPARPASTDRAIASGVVTLREPIDASEAAEVVRAYVRAFEEDDLAAALQLLAQDATSLSRVSGKSQLVEMWKAKAKIADARKVGSSGMTRVVRVAVSAYDTAAFDSAERPKQPLAMRPGDLYVRVTLSHPRVTTDGVFGRILLLLLRREGGHVRIAGQSDSNEDESP